jgi:hypothetical protein
LDSGPFLSYLCILLRFGVCIKIKSYKITTIYVPNHASINNNFNSSSTTCVIYTTSIQTHYILIGFPYIKPLLHDSPIMSRVVTPLWAKWEDETHTPKSGNLESSGTPRNSELDCRGQNTSHWGVLDIIGKALKWKCPKWPRMCHLDICSPSYGQKKGRESNWQFDSRPQKVGNRPDPDVLWGSAMWRWKALEESYKIDLELVPIGDTGKKLWWPKILGVQTGTVSRLHFGSPGTKSHLGVGTVEQRREYYMGEGGGFPRARAVVSQVSPRSPVACPNTKRIQNEF